MGSATNLEPTSGDAAKRILTALATLAITVVIYGSWLPFEFNTAAWGEQGLRILARITWAETSYDDVLTNVLIYVPIGLFLSARLMLSAWKLLARITLTSAVACLVILLAEGGQTVIPARHASFGDMLCNAAGTIVGLALAPFAWRRLAMLTDRLKLALADRPARVLFWLVAVLVVLAKLVPFDLAIRPADWSRAIAQARWSPFAAAGSPQTDQLERLVEMAGSFFAFALLGILAAMDRRERNQPRATSAVNSIATLIPLAVGVELLQLLLVSRRCDLSDALTYVYGAVVGAILGATTMYQRWNRSPVVDDNPGGRVLLMAALVLQVALIVGQALPAANQWSAPTERSIRWIPFYAQYQESFGRGVGEIVSSLMWYTTLGIIAASVVARRSWHYRFVMAAFLTVGVVTLTEAVQAFSAARTADVTEPLLAIFASVIATRACRWFDQLRLQHVWRSRSTPTFDFDRPPS